MSQPQIIDGFTYSLNRLLLPINYASAVLAQMETLRLAGNYQFKAFCTPQPSNVSSAVGGITPANTNPIPAYGQLEQQLQIDPGSYIYGWAFYANTQAPGAFHILVTDSCTETPLSSDYILATLLDLNQTSTSVLRGPCLLPQPRLISDPGLVNVEIYNNSATALIAQLVLYCATPRPGAPPYALSPSNPGWHPGATSGRPQY